MSEAIITPLRPKGEGSDGRPASGAFSQETQSCSNGAAECLRGRPYAGSSCPPYPLPSPACEEGHAGAA